MGKHIHVTESVSEKDKTLHCRNCGIVPYVIKKGIPRCSVAVKAQQGDKGPRSWKDIPYLRSTDKDGYVRITRYGKATLEHREVMEQILGRKLLRHENVHHVNGVRDDNRPENLELWIKKQPSGQRPADLVKWAKEILDLYGEDFG